MSTRWMPRLPLFAAMLLLLGGCQPFFGYVPTPKEFKATKPTLPPKADTLTKDGERFLMLQHTLRLDGSDVYHAHESEHVQVQSLTWKTTQSDNVTVGAVVFTPQRKIVDNYARLIRPNGWISPARGFFNWPYIWNPDQQDDGMWQLWFLGNVVPGTVHEYLVNYRMDFVHYRFLFQRDREVTDASFQFSAPNGYDFHARVYGGQGVDASAIRYRTQSDPQRPNHTLHIWSAQNLPALEKEEGQPDQNTLSARVEIAPKRFRYNNQIHDAATWKDIAAFESKILDKSSAVTPKIKEETDRVISGASNEREKVRSIFRFVRDKIRYIPRTVGTMTWTTQSAEKTLELMYGDDRAKAALTKAMLEAAGVNSKIARIRTRDLGPVDPQFPSPLAFNHTVNYVPSVDNGMYVDASKQGSVFGVLRWEDQDASVLVLDNNQSEPTRTPHTAPNENLRDRRVRLQVDGEAVKGSFTLRLQGHHRVALVERFNNRSLSTSGGKLAYATELLAYLTHKKILQDLRVTNAKIDGLGTPTPSITADFVAKLHKNRKTECEYYVHFDFHSEHQNFLKSPRQHHPYLWRATGRFIDEIEINGLKSLELPSPFKLDTPQLAYRLTTEAKGKRNLLRAEYHFRKDVFTNDEYKGLQESFLKIDNAENTLLVCSTMKPGCPGGDKDGDGVPDELDKCPDVRGPKENQGCPDTDRDGDGIVDRLDKCPDVPGVKEKDGCPAVVLVKVTEAKIEILEKIFFRTGRDNILPKSFPVLDQVVSVLKSRPKVRVRIEGHTDIVGNAKRNRALSDRRARSVKAYLMKKGIDKDRLEYKGFGPDKPIADNKTKDGRAKNRRVEFNIISQ